MPEFKTASLSKKSNNPCLIGWEQHNWNIANHSDALAHTFLEAFKRLHLKLSRPPHKLIYKGGEKSGKISLIFPKITFSESNASASSPTEPTTKHYTSQQETVLSFSRIDNHCWHLDSISADLLIWNLLLCGTPQEAKRLLNTPDMSLTINILNLFPEHLKESTWTQIIERLNAYASQPEDSHLLALISTTNQSRNMNTLQTCLDYINNHPHNEFTTSQWNAIEKKTQEHLSILKQKKACIQATFHMNHKKLDHKIDLTQGMVTACSNKNSAAFYHHYNTFKKLSDEQSKRLTKKITHIINAVLTFGISALVRTIQRRNFCFWKTRSQLATESMEKSLARTMRI